MDYDKEDTTNEIENQLDKTEIIMTTLEGTSIHKLKTIFIEYSANTPFLIPVIQQRSFQFIKQFGICIYNFCWLPACPLLARDFVIEI